MMWTRIVQGNKLKLFCLIVLQTLHTAGSIGVALLLNILIDAVAGAINTGETDALLKCAAFCCAYAVILGLVIFLFETCKASSLKHIMLNIRSGIVRGILKKSIPDFQSLNNAEYITLLNQNLSTLEENYLKNLLSIYESFISILFAVALLVYINPIIAVISIAAMSIPSLIPKLFGGALGKLQSAIMRRTADYNIVVKDVLNGFEVIKTYKISGAMLDNHAASAFEMEESKARFAGRMAWVYGLASMSSVAVQFIIMALSGVFAVRGFISIGSIIAVTQLTGQAISPAFQLSTKISQLKATKPVCDQIIKTVADERAVKEDRELPEMLRTLSLDDVTFSRGNAPILKHVNTCFEQGKKYAIVGKSGSGKSTLLKLIAGYYTDYEGGISIDGGGESPCDLTLISQDVFLFDDTIRNNITLFGNFLEEDILAAIHSAGLDEVVAGLEQGLDTPVEENGSRFSGGEKQRIAIARALLHKKNMMLFDEVTSSLDNEYAKRIEESILDLAGITCISVTHKLLGSVLREYDCILVMDNGEIVETGTYQELIGKGGLFQQMYSTGAA